MLIVGIGCLVVATGLMFSVSSCGSVVRFVRFVWRVFILWFGMHCVFILLLLLFVVLFWVWLRLVCWFDCCLVLLCCCLVGGCSLRGCLLFGWLLLRFGFGG